MYASKLADVANSFQKWSCSETGEVLLMTYNLSQRFLIKVTEALESEDFEQVSSKPGTRQNLPEPIWKVAKS